MNKKYIGYCGIYCENCAVKVKVEPASKILYAEMKKAGFEEIMHLLPDGDRFWSFIEGMAVHGVCASCKEGGGNPECAVRICAKEKNIEICASCESYPCEKFAELFKGYPLLPHDNSIFREKGMEAWSKLQEERKKRGFTYADEK
ncbi:MAG: DUF3795 domain-containing protein [Candidatus Azobacteroides sp.]|nr:DUF3795 domain-containing protein [Candidatus Azobacteroides sp.]